MKSKGIKRREFMSVAGASAAGFMIVPRHVLGGSGFISPSDKLNLAAIGSGGKGHSDILNTYNEGQENIVALCDVDEERASRIYKMFPKVPKYRDFREMLDKHPEIDAVTVSTPDNTHAVAAMDAMKRGKHVFVQKPLTHDIFEARALTEAAVKYNVKTQMGNQGASGEGTQQVVEWIEAGVIGDVYTVHAWTNRPVWPQGLPTPTGEFKVPSTLDWDLWLGPAAFREYNPAYLPFKWRGWWDFGTGALGDMACHILDPAFRALKLGHPLSVEASTSSVYVGDFQMAHFPDSCPPASKIIFEYPERNGLPAVTLKWYDGGIRPDRPEELGPDEEMGNWDGGLIFEGSKGKLMCDCYGANPRLLPLSKMDSFTPPSPTRRRIEEGHAQNWIRSIKGEIDEAISDFSIAGPLTETILIGNLALRCITDRQLKPGKKAGDWAPWEYPGQKKLVWDAENLRVSNYEEANKYIRREYREGYTL